MRKEKPGSSYTYSRRKKRKTKQKDDNFFGNIHQTEEKLIQNEKNGSNTRKVKISDFKWSWLQVVDKRSEREKGKGRKRGRKKGKRKKENGKGKRRKGKKEKGAAVKNALFQIVDRGVVVTLSGWRTVKGPPNLPLNIFVLTFFIHQKWCCRECKITRKSTSTSNRKSLGRETILSWRPCRPHTLPPSNY